VASPPDAAPLREALERLRDPSHVRTLSTGEVRAALEGAGLVVERTETFEHERDFAEWAAIVDDASRTEPLEAVMRALARAGLDAGIALREEGERLRFTYTWQLACARVPTG